MSKLIDVQLPISVSVRCLNYVFDFQACDVRIHF